MSRNSPYSELTQEKNQSFKTSSYFFVGILGLFLLSAVVFILKVDTKDGFGASDDLITTGGAVRSVPSGNGQEKFAHPVCETKECYDVAKYIKDSMNTSRDPCNEFFEYACGGWITKNPIPKTSSTYSTFSKLNQKVEKVLRSILEQEEEQDDEAMKKVKRFYHSCMNQNVINEKGIKPMKDLIKYLGSWSIANDGSWNEETWELKPNLLKIHQEFTSAGGPLISIHVSDDPVHNTKHIVEIDQAGPNLPKEIYKNESKTLKAYKEYMVDVARLLGAKDDVEVQANETIEFEKELADISVRDDAKTDSWFRNMSAKELISKAPEFPWLDYVNIVFENVTTITEDEMIIVPAMEYLQKVWGLVSRTKKSTLSNYLVWSIIQEEVPYLSQPFLEARMRYKEKILGSKGLRKRWKTCVTYANEYLGEILGALYIKKQFNDEHKTMAENMITNIRHAFRDNVKTLTWMDAKTKSAVEEKDAALSDQVGYPKYIHNATRFKTKYEKLRIESDDLFGNRMSMIKFAHGRMLKKLRKKVDKEEWPMDPQTINAMYSFNDNGMIIPAGILQQPFFHGSKVPMSLTYGAIGSILGHELTHGFDNTGRKFNKHGELRDQWWTDASLRGFKNRSYCMENQYNQYKINGKYKLNGKLTLGENIADNGGFKTSLRAYHNWLKKNKADQTLPGLQFTSDQLFHLAFAQAYCSNSRPAEQYLATLNDRHSEEKFRVVGTLSNSKEFSRAFNCPVGAKLNPAKKCYIWVDESLDVEK